LSAHIDNQRVAGTLAGATRPSPGLDLARMCIKPLKAASCLTRWALSIFSVAMVALFFLSGAGMRVGLNTNPTWYELSGGQFLAHTNETTDGGPVTSIFANQLRETRWTAEWEPALAAWPRFNSWMPRFERGYVPGIRLNNATGYVRMAAVPLLPIATLPLAAAVGLWAMHLSARSQNRSDHCQTCGYHLAGLAPTQASGCRCPQCGFETRISRTKWPPR
jgi:hypothetical protein